LSARPRIGIDAHFLSRHEGNRAYVLGLLRGLARIDAEVDARAYVLDVEQARAAVPDPRVTFAPLAPGAPLARVAVAPVLAWLRDRLDLWHGTFSAPPLGPRYVLAVHDVLFATRPELLPRRLALRLSLTLPRAIRRAARVVVPTEAVRADLLARVAVDPARVSVVPFGIDTSAFRPDPATGDQDALERLGLARARPFVLYVGRLDARKGIASLITALARLGGPAPLVVAGPSDPVGAARLGALAAREQVELLFAADVPDAALPALYRAARAVGYPSRGEGVGVPALEALATGTPLVATDLPAIREIAGDAATALVPPGDVEALAAGLGRALESSARATARERGPARVARFGIEAMARGTVDAWRAALGTTTADA
jgi:glycosyltransferase involved in cell wall biosynthesis